MDVIKWATHEKKPTKKIHKKKEELTVKDFIEMNMSTYKRHKGAIRNVARIIIHPRDAYKVSLKILLFRTSCVAKNRSEWYN